MPSNEPLRDTSTTSSANEYKHVSGEVTHEERTEARECGILPERIGSYEILGLLGEGGMGVVYKARDPNLKRLVALKMVRSGSISERERQRFRAEAEAIARLQHPGIISIYEVGEHQGAPYCSLEYVEGGSLAGRLAGRSLTSRRAARLLESLARAAHAVHELQLVHRDLKPSNVLLQGRPEDPVEHCTPKITDFGLAKMLDAATDAGITREGAILGTPYYMAPEQASGSTSEIDCRTDVYALGAILFEVLTGRPPFKGDSVSETLLQVMNEDPPSPRKLCSGIDRDLEIICLKCLEKEPNRRFATALDLADELERYLNDEPILTHRIGVLERGFKWARRRPAAAAAWFMAVLVAIVGSAGGFACWQWLLAEAARDQAVNSRHLAEQAKQQAVDANAGLEQQKRLADEARSWALKDRLRMEQLLQKAREPLVLAEQQLRQKLKEEYEKPLEQLKRRFYFRQIDLAYRAWYSDQLSLARETLMQCPVEGRSWEYGFVHRLCEGAKLPLPPGVFGPFNDLALSRDGTRLALAGSEMVSILDVPKMTRVASFAKSNAWVRFSPDGKRILCPDQKGVKFYDATSGKPQQAIQNLVSNRVRLAEFSPDGSRLAIVDEGKAEVVLIEVATGKRLLTLPGQGEETLMVTYSPDGKWLATATNSGFRIWEAQTGKLVRSQSASIAGHFQSLAFLRDGSAIAFLHGSQCRIQDVASGKSVSPPIHPGQKLVRCITILPDGRLVSGGSDSSVRVWRLGTNLGYVYQGLPSQVNFLIADPKSRFILALDREGNVAWWDPSKEQEGQILSQHELILGVAFHPRNQAIATVSHEGLSLFDPETGKQTVNRLGGEYKLTRVTYAGQGRWLIGGGDNGLVVFETAGLREVWKDKGKVDGFAVSPDGTRLVVASQNLTVRDVASGRELVRCEAHSGELGAVAFAPDGKRFAVLDKSARKLVLFETATGRLQLTIDEAWPQALAWSSDGNRIACASDTDVVIRDAKTGAPLRRLRHVSLVNAVAFSADGKRIATAGWDQKVYVWDVETGLATLTLVGHNACISALAFSLDGRWLASSDWRGMTRLWDAGASTRNPENGGPTSR